MEVMISDHDSVNESEVLQLYLVNQWSAAEKPQLLLQALQHSHSLVTARINGRLFGLRKCDFRRLSSGVFPAFIGSPRGAATGHWSSDHARNAATLFRISSENSGS